MREFTGTWMRHSGDFWGGFAAMLVALPASVAFGVTVYSAVSPHHAAFGALAGILGATALGLIAPTFGGTDRLISSPCAPAAAVLTAFAMQLVTQGVEPFAIVLMMTVLGILTGLLQMLIGFLGVGKLIKYIPYPVVSGYLSGVGLIIIGGQLPTFAGAPTGSRWFEVAMNPQVWDLRGLAVGGVTVVAMLGAPRLTKAVPGTIVGIVAGILTFAGIAIVDPSMRTLQDNLLVIGPLGATGEGYVQLITDRWYQIGEMTLSQVAALIGGAVTLAALLSIDTLKTCVVLDQMTRTRHDPNRELAAQGLANVVASTIGGMPGAGTMGASMVNLSSGGETRISGIIAGVMTLVVALLLGAFVAWIPIAALSGVLIVEDGQSRFVRRGERIGDWTLDSLQDRAAGFVRGAERRSIELSVAPADATPAPAGPRSNRGAAQPTVPAPTASPAAVSRPRPASPAPALAAPAATPAPAADGPPAKRGSFGGSAPSRPPAPDSAAR